MSYSTRMTSRKRLRSCSTAEVDQRHQRRELVPRGAGPGLEDCDDALAQRQRIRGADEVMAASMERRPFEGEAWASSSATGSPEIIRAQGRTDDTRVLVDDAYRAALLDKLVEESEELRAAPPDSALDEAADVYERCGMRCRGSGERLLPTVGRSLSSVK